jgi:rhodanese-related sulfurtransferase
MKKFLILGLIIAVIAVAGCTGTEADTTTGPTDTTVDTGEDTGTVDTGEDTDEEPLTYTDLEVTEAYDLYTTNDALVVLDVSTEYTFGRGHITNAINIPVGELEDRISELDSSAEYLVYCHAEAASMQAAQTLVDNGFASVNRLVGGYSYWLDYGYPFEK